MTKIATIISALAEATQTIATDQWGVDHRVCCGGDTEFDHLSDCLWMQALAAARELKAIYPQGAKVRPAEFIAAASIGVGADFVGTPMIWAEFPTRPERIFVVHDVGCAVNGYGECDCFGGVKA